MKSFRRVLYERMRDIFGFDEWHITPADERDYAKHIIHKVNKWRGIDKEVIEIGCGLGDIISGINHKRKYGYDLSESVIRAARIAHPLCRFEVGSFTDIVNRNVSVLIAVNFLHTIDSKNVEYMFGEIIKNNSIEAVIVDKVKSPPYAYAHDWVVFSVSSSIDWYILRAHLKHGMVAGEEYYILRKRDKSGCI